MKSLILTVSLILLGGLLWARSALTQIGDTFVVNESDVQAHEHLVLSCLDNFTPDGIAGVVTVFRIEHQGAANIDSAGIHDFVKEYLRAACAGQDCADVVVQATICSQLVSYAQLPF